MLISGPVQLANAGMVFFPITLAHFFVGNVAIGFLEGWIASKLLRIERLLAIKWFIAANFASFLLGSVLTALMHMGLSSAVPEHKYIQLTQWVLAGTLAGAFLVTVAIELPFCLRITPKSQGRWRRALLVTLTVHAVSYPLIGTAYLLPNSATLYTSVSHDHSMSFVLPEHRRWWVYFVDETDLAAPKVCRIRLDGTGREVVTEVHWNDGYYEHYEVFLLPSEASAEGTPSSSDLWIIGHTAESNHTRRERLLRSVTPHAAPPMFQARGSNTSPVTWVFLRELLLPVDWRAANERSWEFVRGFTAVNRATGKQVELYVFHPYDSYEYFDKLTTTTIASILPGDVSVSQFGKGNGAVIVVFDLPQRKLGVLTRGVSPVVVPAE